MTEDEFVRPMRLDLEGIAAELQRNLLKSGKWIPAEPFIAMVLRKSKRKMRKVDFFNLVSEIAGDMTVTLRIGSYDCDIVAQKDVEGNWNA